MGKRKFRLASVVAAPEQVAELDATVLRTRLFGESKYDPAILGSVSNPDGVLVLIYDWEKLEDIRAWELIQQTGWEPDGNGNYDSPEGTPWTLASAELSREISTAFPRALKPVPVIASQAVEDPESYPEDAYLYDVSGETWVSWSPEH